MKAFAKLSVIAAAAVMGAVAPAHPLAALAASGNVYISEVKVGAGKTADEAKKELLEEGYTILTQDGGGYADLNEGAGSDNALARGQKIVYLGYKTTMNASEAITDLATMNMRGGYSVKDYEELMATRLKTQIIPFVERFVVTIQEYRDNLTSEYATNKARAEYMRSMLNKLRDDDTGGLMGDLLVNETKYEMGDEAYAALPEAEKKAHADILTIVMQANGKNMLSMETFLTKASDADPDGKSWIDRLEDNTLDDLRDQLEAGGVDVADLDETLDRMYGDDAAKLLEKWDVFYQALLDYDEKTNALLNIDEHAYDEQIGAMEQYDEDASIEKNIDAIVAENSARADVTSNTLDLELIAAKQRLDEIDYGDGTLAEFFETDASAFNGDGIRDLYPIVASLSAGQLAGIDFLSLQDLVTIATADETNYDLHEFDDIPPAMIYEGVNREIFTTGKVALTNKALRAEAMKNDAVTDYSMSVTTCVLWGATAVASIGMIASWFKYSQLYDLMRPTLILKDSAIKTYEATLYGILELDKQFDAGQLTHWGYQVELQKLYTAQADTIIALNAGDFDEAMEKADKALAPHLGKSRIAAALGALFTVAMAALAAFSIYSTIKEMMDFYKVEYTPIPKYIVDEEDITEEVNGVKTVVRNDSAYYQVAETNRKADAEFYDVLQNYADLNGDVCAEWLALYYVRYQGKAPILADSLKVVKGSDKLPSGYERSVHMFGVGGAQNLNSRYYCYNDPTDGIYVHFKVDESAVASDASVAGSTFSAGSAALFAGIGAVAGAGIAVAIMLILSKKKKAAPAAQ